MLKKILFYTVALNVMNVSYSIAQMSQTTLFYNVASTGNIAQVKALINRGYSLDAEDAQGNTALCVAWQKGNKQAYNVLLRAGASTSAQCLNGTAVAQTQNKGLLVNGGISDTVYSEYPADTSIAVGSSFWSASYTSAVIGLLAAGGAVVALASGGGSGGSSAKAISTPNDDDILKASISSCLGGDWVNNNGVYECHCRDNKILKNGVCVIQKNDEDYQTADKINSEDIVITSEDELIAAGLLAELGAKIKNSGSITGTTEGISAATSERGFDLYGLKVNGFSKKAYSGKLTKETLLTSSAASSAINEGEIRLIQGENGGKLYGIQALSGALAYNSKNGTISLDVCDSSRAYGIYAEDYSDGITNDGTIKLNISNKADEIYGIYAPERGALSTGSIELTVTDPYYNESLSGTLAGIYAYNARNRGIITLRRGEDEAPFDDNNLNIYGMYITGDTVNKKGLGENQKDGIISFDVTGTPFYTYGMYADKGVEHLKNDGRIEIYGNLAHILTNDSIGGTYGMRFTGGSGSIINNGTITTSRVIPAEDEDEEDVTEYLSISGHAFLGLIRGFSGTITNNAKIDLTVLNNATSSSVWTLEAIDLDNGNIVNNSNINIAVETGTNSAVKEGSDIYAIFGGSESSVTNNGKITVLSDTDNLDIVALRGKTMINSEYASIYIKSSGDNVHLTTSEASIIGAPTNNSGDITIIHNGTGSIRGIGGTNQGNIYVESNPKVDTSVSMSVVGMSSCVANENLNNISIVMKGGSYGGVIGIAGTSSEDVPSISMTNAGNLSIKFTDRTQPGIGSVTGISSLVGSRPKSGNIVTNSGHITIDAYGVEKDSSVFWNGTIRGIYGKGTSVTNSGADSLIDIRSSGDFNIIGIQNEAVLLLTDENPDVYETIPSIYKITNEGTVRITARNTVHNDAGTELLNLQGETTNVPFDIIGIATNSFAVNAGDIILDIAGDAKVAGMVAYDGGMAVNTGTIEFHGNPANFTALYGNGVRVFTEHSNEVSVSDITTTLIAEGDTTVIIDCDGDYDCEFDAKQKFEKEEYTTTTTDSTTVTTQYSTVYNYGRIIIYGNPLTSEGNTSMDPDAYSVIENGAVIAKIPVGKTAANQIVETTIEEQIDTTSRNKETVTILGNSDLPDNPKITYTDWVTVEGTPEIEVKIDTSDYVVPYRSSQLLTLNQGVIYSSEQGGSFEAPGYHIQGSVVGGVSNVMGGNQTTYVASGFGEGAVVGDGDDSSLTISSASYLFNASFQQNANNKNGLDIVMNMKSFDDVMDDRSISSFLQSNYAKGNNEAFFDVLKSSKTASEFTSTLNSLIGKETLSKFNWEDLTAMRELNFAMNEEMFNVDNATQIFEKSGKIDVFSFKTNDNSSAEYGVVNKAITPRLRMGYGVAFTSLKTDDANDNKRQDTMVQFFTPIWYEVRGIKMISSPRFGYARGHYTRQGFDGSYKGYVEKRVFGVTNEARYPIDLGIAVIEPTFELNAIGYTQKGQEDAKAYSLNIQKGTTISVESGLGLYAKKVFGNWNVKSGLLYYHEFANPYEIQVGMNGMDGSFKLTDDTIGHNRGLAVFDLTYNVEGFSVYGHIRHFIQNENQTTIKAGLKFEF